MQAMWSGGKGLDDQDRESIGGNESLGGLSGSQRSTRSHVPGMRFLHRNNLLVRLSRERARRFGFATIMIVIATMTWLIIRYYLMLEGENTVTKNAFDKLAQSITNSIKAGMQQDLVYQDMVANLWMLNPTISRTDFRKFIMSEAYSPGLTAMAGMSLIPRVMGAAERQQMEAGAAEEALRLQCCANATETGASCSTGAASGLFCPEHSGRGESKYQFTQFGDGGVLVPAVGDSQAYLDRVGAEEYMIVHMIEPFETNTRVWGFNLLSSDARLAAWRRAIQSGKKTFTTRLTLVQGTGSEFGVLVWLPIFKDSAGARKTAFNAGNTSGLTAVGSVNGVYFLQEGLTKTIRRTYSDSQLEDVSIFLYDNNAAFDGKMEYLASYGVEDAFETYKDADFTEATKVAHHFQMIDLELETTDLRWKVIVAMTSKYNGKRRTWMPEIATLIGVFFTMLGFMDRVLGHPILLMFSIGGKNEGSRDWKGERAKAETISQGSSKFTPPDSRDEPVFFLDGQISGATTQAPTPGSGLSGLMEKGEEDIKTEYSV